MSIYACSDLHGEFDKFMDLLKVINFTTEDKMYIVGDIFGRGKKQIEILDYIRGKENIILIKGNGEEMLLDSILHPDFYEIEEDMVEEELIEYLTYKKIVGRGEKYVKELTKYINSLPYIIKEDKYILLHASLYLPENHKELTIEEILKLQNENYCLWNRESAFNDKCIEGYTMIFGHTPTFFLGESNGKIVYRTGKIFIDCGASFDLKLGAIRLEDLEEFYV